VPLDAATHGPPPPTTEPAPAAERWQEALTRRRRPQVRTTPLHRLEASKGHLALDVGGQDLRSLALRVLDVCVEEMGLGEGAERPEVVAQVATMARQLESALTSEQAHALAELVVDGLLNERERRVAFCERYVDFGGGAPVARELQYHLLQEVELPDGSLRLKASVEGVNLYAGMLDFEVQDAQVAAEAVLQVQIRRGRIDDALRTARDARLRSIELQERVEGWLRLARRDVTQLRWAGEVLGLLDEALVHIQERIEVERQLLGLVAQRLRTVTDESGPHLAELNDSLNDCMQRHLRLHTAVLGANRAYLDEQESQAFVPLALLPQPDLEVEVLRPALELSTRTLEPTLRKLGRSFLRIRAQPFVYLPQLVDRLLAPPRRAAPRPHAVALPELERLDVSREYFDAEHRAQAGALLDDLPAEGTPLSDLLARAEAAKLSARARQLMVLQVLQGYDEQDADPGLPLQVEAAGRQFVCAGFQGDELLVGPVVEASPDKLPNGSTSKLPNNSTPRPSSQGKR